MLEKLLNTSIDLASFPGLYVVEFGKFLSQWKKRDPPANLLSPFHTYRAHLRSTSLARGAGSTSALPRDRAGAGGGPPPAVPCPTHPHGEIAALRFEKQNSRPRPSGLGPKNICFFVQISVP